jgi:hypothetical protein
MPDRSDPPRGTLDLLILKIVALGAIGLAGHRNGPRGEVLSAQRKGRAQLETAAASWQSLTEAVGLILRLSTGGAE